MSSLKELSSDFNEFDEYVRKLVKENTNVLQTISPDYNTDEDDSIS